MDAHHEDDSGEKLRIALTGFAGALVWLAIVAVISYQWAIHAH
ncbi:MAG TPA: hypothetical protein VFE05_02530 [Longimicrobiaceae bacterium]|jgi:hypothetical protein|nr:hypothetical protein [Longimicrobiaceae bacterium]